MSTLTRNRIESIDVIRGIVMVIMALDHVRDYFHATANVDDPLNLATTTPLLFFTRWITHYCAPTFVFLSGTSIFLQSQRKTNKELGIFLLKRGLWLILAEALIVTFGWTFNPFYNTLAFQVIWAIGISMVILGLMIRMNFSYRLILVLGIIIVAGHNLFDFIEAEPGFHTNLFWDIFHRGGLNPHEYAPKHVILFLYPFPAWTGLMMLGYCAGKIFVPQFPAERRRKILINTGLALIALFFLLRFINIYGDPDHWSNQRDGFYTFLSFLNVHKYPPSFLYLSITIGPALILLALIEKVRNKFTDIMVVYGRTAFFYYILHIYLIHIISAIMFFYRGHTFADAGNIGEKFPFLFLTPGEGYGLGVVYFVWISVVIALYPLCKRYDKYKSAHREKWVLSYL